MSSKIYPAIDIIEGKCVRLTQGDYHAAVTYHDDPIVMAQTFKTNGAEYLHIVDLDAAKNPIIHNRTLITDIIRQTQLNIQMGGGIRTQNDVENLLSIGAHRLIIGSKAFTDKDTVKNWGNVYGWDKIVIGADVSNNKIATHGWLNVSSTDVFDFIDDYLQAGATTFLVTDVSKDGMLEGSAYELYEMLLATFGNINIIASGGVHDMQEVAKLKSIQVESIIIGKALYEGKIDFKDLIE